MVLKLPVTWAVTHPWMVKPSSNIRAAGQGRHSTSAHGATCRGSLWSVAVLDMLQTGREWPSAYMHTHVCVPGRDPVAWLWSPVTGAGGPSHTVTDTTRCQGGQPLSVTSGRCGGCVRACVRACAALNTFLMQWQFRTSPCSRALHPPAPDLDWLMRSSAAESGETPTSQATLGDILHPVHHLKDAGIFKAPTVPCFDGLGAVSGTQGLLMHLDLAVHVH